jgi:hypothetical protein
LALARAPLGKPLEWQEGQMRRLAREQAIAHYLEIFDARLNRWRQLTDLPASKWFDSQRDIQRAWGLVFGKNTRNAPLLDRNHDVVGKRAIRWVGADAEVHSGKLERLGAHGVSDTWTYKCMDAIAEYFANRAAKVMVELLKDFDKAEANAMRATDNYLRMIERAVAVGVKVQSNRTLARFATDGQPKPDMSWFPVARGGAMAAERLFVYRMWRANMAFVRKPKVDAIAALMSVDGFRHQYNHRTIERACAEFHAAAKARREADDAAYQTKKLKLGLL